MVTKEKDFKLVRGNTLTFSFQIVGLEDDIDSAYFGCKAEYTDTEYAFLEEITLLGVTDGVYTVHIAPEDTEDLPIRQYVYDLRINIDDDAYTLMRGALELLPEVVTGEVV